MELRAYLRTLISKWWILLVVFLITYSATLAFTFTQKPVYQGRATYVVKLNSTFSNDKDLASAVDILSRRTEIATTYTIVANSRQLKKLASDALGLTTEQKADVSVSSQLVPGTNVVEIIVQSGDPVLARDFTNAVGTKLVTYTRGLYETYTLELLDPSGLPDKPVKPNKLLNLMLGGVMGLLLGAGLAFLAAYLQAPPEAVANVGILDDETGVYSRRYLTTRLRQELGRSGRNGYPLSLALLNADHRGALGESTPQVRREALRRIALLLTPQLRDEDLMAHVEGATFALLLPDTGAEAARESVERLRALISGSPLDLERSGVKLDLYSSAGIATYPDIAPGQEIAPDNMLEQAARALKQAETAAYGKVYLLPDNDAPEEAADARPVVGVWQPAKAATSE
jgi:diguanylate cyclase (GGDEF)-like protein